MERIPAWRVARWEAFLQRLVHDVGGSRRATGFHFASGRRSSGRRFPNRRDPEEGVEWLVVRVTARATPQVLTAAYREYVARWVRETPAGKRHLVRLSYASA